MAVSSWLNQRSKSWSACPPTISTEGEPIWLACCSLVFPASAVFPASSEEQAARANIPAKGIINSSMRWDRDFIRVIWSQLKVIFIIIRGLSNVKKLTASCSPGGPDGRVAAEIIFPEAVRQPPGFHWQYCDILPDLQHNHRVQIQLFPGRLQSVSTPQGDNARCGSHGPSARHVQTHDRHTREPGHPDLPIQAPDSLRPAAETFQAEADRQAQPASGKYPLFLKAAQ